MMNWNYKTYNGRFRDSRDVKTDGCCSVDDKRTNLTTDQLYFCTGIAIVAEYEDTIRRFLAHVKPEVYSKEHYLLEFAKEFVSSKGILVKQAKLVSSMGYVERGKTSKRLAITETNIIELMKQYLDEANLSQDFTFDFGRATRVSIAPKGKITISKPKETLKTLDAFYKKWDEMNEYGRKALETCPS
ncbi:MAG: hypothetical protein FWC00_03685, partial [Firmicutes bacterium]|nr:hypothetical protein [Bacillota bacterium]